LPTATGNNAALKILFLIETKGLTNPKTHGKKTAILLSGQTTWFKDLVIINREKKSQAGECNGRKHTTCRSEFRTQRSLSPIAHLIDARDRRTRACCG
jgi:hypothetical protein